MKIKQSFLLLSIIWLLPAYGMDATNNPCQNILDVLDWMPKKYEDIRPNCGLGLAYASVIYAIKPIIRYTTTKELSLGDISMSLAGITLGLSMLSKADIDKTISLKNLCSRELKIINNNIQSIKNSIHIPPSIKIGWWLTKKTGIHKKVIPQAVTNLAQNWQHAIDSLSRRQSHQPIEKPIVVPIHPGLKKYANTTDTIYADRSAIKRLLVEKKKTQTATAYYRPFFSRIYAGIRNAFNQKSNLEKRIGKGTINPRLFTFLLCNSRLPVGSVGKQQLPQELVEMIVNLSELKGVIDLTPANIIDLYEHCPSIEKAFQEHRCNFNEDFLSLNEANQALQEMFRKVGLDNVHIPRFNPNTFCCEFDCFVYNFKKLNSKKYLPFKNGKISTACISKTTKKQAEICGYQLENEPKWKKKN